MNKKRGIGSKAQFSIEYIVIVGAVFVILMVIFFYASKETNDAIKLTNAEKAVNDLAARANVVGAGGPGTKEIVEGVMIPSSVESISIKGNEILFKIKIFGGVSDIYAVTKVNVTGSITKSKGAYDIPVEKLPSGIVRIGSYNDTYPPVVIATSFEFADENNILFTATTDEYAYCKYDISDIDYDSMQDTFSGELTMHTTTISIE